jgi:hypothetical protein
MAFKDLIRVDINTLRNRSEIQAYFAEVSERRRQMKLQVSQCDEIIRNLQVVLTRV